MNKNKEFSTDYFYHRDKVNGKSNLEQLASELDKEITEALGIIDYELTLISDHGRLPSKWVKTNNFLNQKVLKSKGQWRCVGCDLKYFLFWNVRVVKNKVTIYLASPTGELKSVLLKRNDIVSKYGRFFWNNHRVKIVRKRKV